MAHGDVVNHILSDSNQSKATNAADNLTTSSGLLTICICAHNPRPELFYEKVLPALRRQTGRPPDVSVLIVDNASEPPIDVSACQDALGHEVPIRVVLEPQLGVVHARTRLIAETSTPWVLFVDDDLELPPNYVENGLKIIAENPNLGCFGGKLILPEYLKPAPWVKLLLPFLAIHDYGDGPIRRCANDWGPWEPAGAGAFVSRALLLRYLDRIRTDKDTHILGHKGHSSLLSGENLLLMRGGFKDGLLSSYEPSLHAYHHLDPRRFELRYLIRLMYNYGRTNVILDRLLRPECAGTLANKGRSLKKALRILRDLVPSFIYDCKQSPRYAICFAAHRIGSLVEQLVDTRDSGNRHQ